MSGSDLIHLTESDKDHLISQEQIANYLNTAIAVLNRELKVIYLNSSAEILYPVEIFKLLKIVIFLGSEEVESLLFTFASRELLILIPIPLE